MMSELWMTWNTSEVERPGAKSKSPAIFVVLNELSGSLFGSRLKSFKDNDIIHNFTKSGLLCDDWALLKKPDVNKQNHWRRKSHF